MRQATPGHHLLGHYPDSRPEDVFEAALETIRELPGWEVLTAHPDQGEIRARARGRIFTPTREHVLHLSSAEAGIDLLLQSVRYRTNTPEEDPQAQQLLRTLLEDNLRMNERP